MLKQRILTALVLLACLLWACFYPSNVPFAVVITLLMSAAAWEWARLNQYGAAASVLSGLVCGLACGAAWYLDWVNLSFRLVWISSGAAWVLLGAWLLACGAAAWIAVPRGLRLLGGLLALCVAWLAIVQARALGLNFLFSALVLVWTADVGAYFSGRLLGGKWFPRRLAPTISPGKTWEGVVGGLLGVFLLAIVWINAERLLGNTATASVFLRLYDLGWPVFLMGVCFLVAMSVVGDLVESLFKRAAGVKDSSNLLPGHGGVLDRIDALLPTLPLAMMLLSLGQP